MILPELDGLAWRKSGHSGTQENCVEIAWRKSSYSGTETDCVEIAFVPTAVAMRDSKNPTGPTMAVKPTTFREFIDTIR
jgi:hypothetical protein